MLKTKKLLIPLLLVLMMLVVSACSQVGDESPALEGTSWKLVELNGRAPVAGSAVTLIFEEDSAGGNTGCNSYGGAYKVEAGVKIEFKDVAQTLMYCMEPEGVMDQESEYTNLLLEAASYKITNDRLEIQGTGENTILAFVRE